MIYIILLHIYIYSSGYFSMRNGMIYIEEILDKKKRS